jgi:hypothetical protein
MGARFVSIDHDTPMLLPPDLRDWVPEDHLVHFIMEALRLLDLRTARSATAMRSSIGCCWRSKVAELLAKADAAESTPPEDGLTVPGEIAHRRERLEKLREATAVIEARAKERHREELASFEARQREREQKQKATGNKPRGREPKPP